MSPFRSLPGLALTAVGLLWLTVAVPACEEDSKTAPEKCLTPPLELYDIQTAPDITGTGGEADTTNPCVTPVGHSISNVATPTAAAGTSSSGGKGGTSGGGKGGSGGKGGTATNDGGAGGAGG